MGTHLHASAPTCLHGYPPACIGTHLHASAHTCMHRHIPAYIGTYLHTSAHTCIHRHIPAYIGTHLPAWAPTCLHGHPPACISTHLTASAPTWCRGHVGQVGKCRQVAREPHGVVWLASSHRLHPKGLTHTHTHYIHHPVMAHLNYRDEHGNSKIER